MKLSEFDYNLPRELIAQAPANPRDQSRLLFLAKESGAISHGLFCDLVDHLQAGDMLVLNESRVIPARLLGCKQPGGGKLEVFLHRRLDGERWECLVGGRGARPGLVIEFSPDLRGEIEAETADGLRTIRFSQSGEAFDQIVSRIGLTPLPPYIKDGLGGEEDKISYQTVYARENGSVAAPTAGLHFTPELLARIEAKGVEIQRVVLHVGLGTFAPVKAEEIEAHEIHSEMAAVASQTIQAILAAKQAGRRIVAVGTTSARTLEGFVAKFRGQTIDPARVYSDWTDIFIYPGYQFQLADALITNFHLPKSTLLMLVSALAGRDNIRRAYEEAIRERYRFFSYGDAMFIF